MNHEKALDGPFLRPAPDSRATFSLPAKCPRGADAVVAHHNTAMSPLLATALADAAPLVCERGWIAPAPATVAAARRLLELVASSPRPPAVQVEPDGRISFEWEAGAEGWLTLSVDDVGKLTHSAVIGEDEFTQAEDFGETLPDWAAQLLGRLLRAGH